MTQFTKQVFAIIMGIALITGCNKVGSEDPSISFKSRDKKVVGTWTLKSYTSTFDETSKTTTNNDANTDNSVSNTTTKNETDYDGSTLTVKESVNVNNDIVFEGAKSNNPSGTRSSNSSYSLSNVTVTLYEDHTYGVSYEHALKSSESCRKVQVPGEEAWTDNCDRASVSLGTSEKYENNNEGTWEWNGAGKEEKMEIILVDNSPREIAPGITTSGFVIDPIGELMNGHITRLSGSELKIATTSNGSDGSTEHSITYVLVGEDRVEAKETTVEAANFTHTVEQVWEKTEKKPSRDSE